MPVLHLYLHLLFIPETKRHSQREREAARGATAFSDLRDVAQPMPACGKIMIAASLLACHSASALRVGSIGTRLARVDPAVWTAAAGIAATTAFVREAVATDECSKTTATAFERNRKALGKVLRAMRSVRSTAFGGESSP